MEGPPEGQQIVILSDIFPVLNNRLNNRLLFFKQWGLLFYRKLSEILSDIVRNFVFLAPLFGDA